MPGYARRASALLVASLFAGLAGCPSKQDPPGESCEGVVCEDDLNPCTDDCVDGTCVHLPNTLPCDDGDACTTLDACGAGSCAGSAVVCPARPNTQCWDEPTCDPASGCQQHRRATGTPCEDGNACSTGDACDDTGACVPTGPVTCSPPGNPACFVALTCDPVEGCAFDFAPSSTSCDDGSLCTTDDQCDGAGGCAGTPVACTGTACTAASCNPATGGCESVPANDGAACSDEDPCTSPDVCSGGACVGAPVTCDDSSACTSDACNPLTGACSNVAVSCDDADACTANGCDPATGCAFTPLTCDDADACTAESCDPATGCAHTPISCDDGKPCTVDSCDGASGCIFTPLPAGTVCVPASCSGSFSNPPATCSASGQCRSTAGVDCGTYMCDPSTGACRTSCTSSTECTPTSFCDGTGHCAAKQPIGTACAVADACTTSYCVDGYCCNAACDGPCQSCGLLGLEGMCRPIPNGLDPDLECVPLTCNGNWSCQ